MIAGAHLPVRADITHKFVAHLFFSFFPIPTAAHAVQVVDVNIVSPSDVLGRHTDLLTIFDDALARLDLPNGNFMPIGHGLIG